MPINIPDDTPKDQANKSIFAGVRDSGGSTLFAPFRAAVVTTLNGIATAALETYDATIAAVLGSKADAGNRSMMKTLDDIETVIGAKNDGYQPGANSTTSLTQSLRGTLHWLSVIQPTIGLTNSDPASNSTGTWSINALLKRIASHGDTMLTRLAAIHGGVDTLVANQIEPVEAGRVQIIEATGAMVWHGSDDEETRRRFGLYVDESDELGGEWMGAFGAGLMAVSGGTTNLDHSRITNNRVILLIPLRHFTRMMLHMCNTLTHDGGETATTATVEFSLVSLLGSAYENGIPYGDPNPTAERYHKLALSTETVTGDGGRKTFGNVYTLIGTSDYTYLDALSAGAMFLRMEVTTSADPTDGDLQLLIVRS